MFTYPICVEKYLYIYVYLLIYSITPNKILLKNAHIYMYIEYMFIHETSRVPFTGMV